MRGAYYNEHDKHAAAWLRQLIADGLIAPGDVDERSIEDVLPSDLRGYAQCHFFAGIGVWSYALRQAGWGDERPVWTGSCPCQPFSAAGQGSAFADERHLWPAFFHLIGECRPAVVFGEQVASKDAEPWLDLVQADLEGLDYAVGAVPFPSAGIGAPHIRDRLYWVADAAGSRFAEQRRGTGQSQGFAAHRAFGGMADAHGGDAGAEREQCGREYGQQPADGGAAGGLGDADGERAGRHGRAVRDALGGENRKYGADHAGASGGDGGLADDHGVRCKPASGAGFRADAEHDAESFGGAGRVADADAGGQVGWSGFAAPGLQRAEFAAENLGGVGCVANAVDERCEWRPGNGWEAERGIEFASGDHRPGPTNGFWRAADWLLCRDGKWRPVEPGTFPLVDGPAGGVVRGGDQGLPIDAGRSAEARVMRLRGYGNAINAEQARLWIEVCRAAWVGA